MLKREQDSIVGAISTQWNSVSQIIANDYEDIKKATVAKFEIDPEFLNIVESLESAGCLNAEEMARVLIHTGGGYGLRPSWSTSSLPARVREAIDAIPRPVVPAFYTDECYGILTIALSTCRLKWPALQPHVYVLVSGLSAAKTYDDLRKVVIAFTTAIAS